MRNSPKLMFIAAVCMILLFGAIKHYYFNGKGSFDKSYTYETETFRCYSASSDEDFDLAITDNQNIYSVHWTEQEEDGEDSEGNTEYKTVDYYSVTAPPNVVLYYKHKGDYLLVTSTKLKKFKTLENNSFFSFSGVSNCKVNRVTNFDFKKANASVFKLNDTKFAEYACYRNGSESYIIGIMNNNGGQASGGGNGGTW